jgi:hypothetical protein
MNSTPDNLDRITAVTLEHYDREAQACWEATRDRDVSQNVAALLRHIEAVPPYAERSSRRRHRR